MSTVYTASVRPIDIYADANMSSYLTSYGNRSSTSLKTVVSSFNFSDIYQLSGARYFKACYYLGGSGSAGQEASANFKVKIEARNSLGELSDSSPATFYGAWNTALSAVLSVNPDVKVGLIINDSNMKRQLHDAMIDIGKYWGIPVLDLKNNSDISFMTCGTYASIIGRYDI